MRTRQHIIDTKAIKKVLNAMPDHWVVRELTERDYGTDLVIEIFAKGGNDKAGNEAYIATGGVINVQVKGTDSQLKINNDDTVSFQLDKKALVYMDNFHTPFLLFNVGVTKVSEPFYFVWVQRYIRDVLDVEKPYWRDENQKSHSIKLPIKNEIKKSIEKIERIALWPRYLQEIVDFNESYTHLKRQLMNISKGICSTDEDHLKHLVAVSRRILKLNILFLYLPCAIDKRKANSLFMHVAALTPKDKKEAFYPFENMFDFDSVLTTLDGIESFEEFTAKSYGETVY